MPWSVVPDHPDCPPGKPFGVVNKTTGRKVACHADAASARRQVAALYANVPESQQAGFPASKVIATQEGSMIRERLLTPLPVEYRDDGGGQSMIAGYAAVYGKPSKNLGGFIEVVEPTFPQRSASRGWPNIIARYNHDDNYILGNTDSGTLRVHSDDEGLFYRVNPPKSLPQVIEAIQRGDVRSSSFAFYVVEDDWTVSEQDYPQRNLISGDIVDVSPVANPAYLQTTAAVEDKEATLQAASMSLAKKTGEDPTECRELLVEQRAISLFRRTDGPKPAPKREPVLGQKAVMDMLAKKDDPYAESV